jgi:hypothetical protein
MERAARGKQTANPMPVGRNIDPTGDYLIAKGGRAMFAAC